MAVRRNNQGEDGTGMYPYAEIDFTHNSEDYVVRITAVPPYRTATRVSCTATWTGSESAMVVHVVIRT